MRTLDDSDFRARRFMLEEDDFGLSTGMYPGPTNLIDEGTWRSMVALVDDVSIRTSDKYGEQLKQMWNYWDMWNPVTYGVQDLSKKTEGYPTAMAASDAADEFQAATYAVLVGYYRVAFSCLRNVLEQITIAAELTISGDVQGLTDWRNGEDRIRFGWAADMLSKNLCVADLERHVKAAADDSVFGQTPKGLVRRLFVELSKYTHGVPGYTDGDFRQSNGPIFLEKTFLDWCVAALKTYTIVLHELKLVHPLLDSLPLGPPSLTLDKFRRDVLADLPTDERDLPFLQCLAGFWG